MFSLLNFDQSLSKISDLLWEGFERISGATKNWGRWSEIVSVRFPNIISLESLLEKMLSVRVFKWLVSLIGYKIYIVIELEVKESRKWLVGWCIL